MPTPRTAKIVARRMGRATGGAPADGQQWVFRRTSARLPQSMSPTLDEYTGDVIPAKLVAAAKEEEVAAMESVWDVWGVAPVGEAWKSIER